MIHLIVPSYGRPDRCSMFLTSAFTTCKNPKGVRATVCLSEGDPKRHEYTALLSTGWPVELKIYPDEYKISPMFNDVALRSNSEIFGIMADDVIVRTYGWDVAINETLDQTKTDIQLVCPEDGTGTRQHFPHFFVTREWVQEMGYVFHPAFGHFNADTYLKVVLDHCGQRIYAPNILFEHQHFKYGKAELDDTYRKARVGPYLKEPNETLQRLEPQARIDIRKAIARWGVKRRSPHLGQTGGNPAPAEPGEAAR